MKTYYVQAITGYLNKKNRYYPTTPVSVILEDDLKHYEIIEACAMKLYHELDGELNDEEKIVIRKDSPDGEIITTATVAFVFRVTATIVNAVNW